MNKTTQVFYRLVKANHGHPFSGLYAVEKVFFKDGVLVRRSIVHEWDLRIIAEAKLAQLGGDSAYEAYKMDNDLGEVPTDEGATEATGRKTSDLTGLTQRKLNKEMRLPEKE
jgi:hypothetical protein